jgi:hypothetical protein
LILGLAPVESAAGRYKEGPEAAFKFDLTRLWAINARNSTCYASQLGWIVPELRLAIPIAKQALVNESIESFANAEPLKTLGPVPPQPSFLAGLINEAESRISRDYGPLDADQSIE